jgi:hypothetical protein
LRIGAQTSDHVRVFEEEITRLGETMSEQMRFSCTARTGQHDGGKISYSRAQLHFELSWDVFHV